jgi:hypothetical protein
MPTQQLRRHVERHKSKDAEKAAVAIAILFGMSIALSLIGTKLGSVQIPWTARASRPSSLAPPSWLGCFTSPSHQPINTIANATDHYSWKSRAHERTRRGVMAALIVVVSTLTIFQAEPTCSLSIRLLRR